MTLLSSDAVLRTYGAPQPILALIERSARFSEVLGSDVASDVDSSSTQPQLGRKLLLQHYRSGTENWGPTVASIDVLLSHFHANCECAAHAHSSSHSDDAHSGEEYAHWSVRPAVVTTRWGPLRCTCEDTLEAFPGAVVLYRCRWRGCRQASAIVRRCAGCLDAM